MIILFCVNFYKKSSGKNTEDFFSPDLTLADEPTSNLDPLAETEIFEKYNSLAKDKSVIYVTHRISVAKLADRIIVFKNGKIEEDGSFDELMQLKGEFARLYEVQSQWYDR